MRLVGGFPVLEPGDRVSFTTDRSTTFGTVRSRLTLGRVHVDLDGGGEMVFPERLLKHETP